MKKHRTLASWLLIIFQTVFGIILGAPWLLLGLLMVDAFIIFKDKICTQIFLKGTLREAGMGGPAARPYCVAIERLVRQS